jgi:5'-nucleotidase/UDP-sugar diphosphatase
MRPIFFTGLILLLGLLSCTVETEQPVIAGKTVRLTILRTADVHSRIFPYSLKPNSHDVGDGLFEETAPYGGLERIAALIQRERRRAQRVVYLDSGDVFQGAPIFNYGDGEPEFRWLSTVMVDAMVVGNHEFDKGAENLAQKAERWITFPFLAANYVFDDWSEETSSQLGASMEPYTILNVQGLKLGIIGMGDIGSMYSITQGGNSLGITPVEANEAVRAYVEFLSPVVDLIVVLSHLGLSEDQELTAGHEIYMTAGKDVQHYLDRPLDPWVQLDCPECREGVVKYWVPGVRGIDIILGGHLHILTHPPMVLTDPAGRKVILEHPGAFAKFLTRLDLAVAVPADRRLAPFGAEIIAHQHEIFPIDTLWCAEPRLDPYAYEWGDDQGFPRDIQTVADYCAGKGDFASRNLLEGFRIGMELDPSFDLTQIFGYAPVAINRKDTATGGDSPLGNMTARAMMIRKRVEAEFCITNTLGIRDNLYAGAINMETIFNVFPFENTITVMYLSGREVQELFDFVTERSNTRGCQSQAQISGCSFTMNCGQVKRNEAHSPCQSAEDCCQYRPEICEAAYAGSARWECNQGACYSHPGEDVLIGGRPLDPNASYKLATNDYIAGGGSGFNVLKRNTTKMDTGIAMRDALTEYLTRFPTCRDLLQADPNQVDAVALSFCLTYQNELDQVRIPVQGNCTCGDVFLENTDKCGAVTPPMVKFCNNPLDFPVIAGESDGRILRKVN